MAEILISVAAKLAEYLVGPALREGQYLFCTGKIKRNLESKREELILTQGRVQRLVEEALNKTEEIDGAVKKWESDVKEIIAEVETLEQELKANSGCVRGCCPSWMRYHLCKQLAKKTMTMIQLNTNSVFNPLSHPTLLPDTVESFSSGNFMYFQSTKLAFDQLLAALRDESCYMIGLCGMGGAGKTTLAKELGKKAKNCKLFDHVVVTTASQKPDFKKIQQEIAEQLSIELKEETVVARAMRLSKRLTSGERILIILDDVWAKLNLSENIGIPSGSDHKGCKVLMTTRLIQVCKLMNCQSNIPLHLLSEEDAWTLFCKCASIDDHTPSSSLTVARAIVGECNGLPIGIEAVGTTLRGKSLHHWKAALHDLKNSKPLDVEEGVRDAFTCLQLSYNHLRSQEARSLFLMCAMFPEDHAIFIEDLFKYAVGRGLLGQVKSFDIARSKVNTIVDNLIYSCLLTRLEKNYLKMHDMVRDLALWIASKGEQILNDANILAEDEVVKNCSAICLWSDSTEIINWFSHKMDAPKLEILSLNLGYNQSDLSWNLSDASFHMNSLKVMTLNNMYQSSKLTVSLPQSAQWLTNLRTLRLVGMKLGEISFVISLTRLEILDLGSSEFKELPNGIKNLDKLKLLDLSYCNIEECCSEVLARCSKLEELYVYTGEVNRPQITSYECFREDTSLQKLQRYQIQVGKLEFDSHLKLQHSSRSLLFKNLDMFASNAIIKNLLQRAYIVCLKSLEGGCKNIIPELIQQVGDANHNDLEKLLLYSCLEIKCLFNTTPGECNLGNLKQIKIVYCPQLTSLFPLSAAQTMLQLEMLYIKDCSKLKCIILNGEGGSNTSAEILSASDINSHYMFPQLTSLCISKCDELEEIIDENVESQHISSAQLCFPKLEHLEIRQCNKLRRLFSTITNRMLPQLNSLCISKAAQLKELFGCKSEDETSNREEIVIPNLTKIELIKLPILIDFCQGLKVQAGKQCKIKIHECPRFAPIVGSTQRIALAQWRTMTVKGLDHQLYNEVSNDVIKEQEMVVISTPKWLYLKHLHHVMCLWDGPTLISFQNLQWLKVVKCSKLKCIFSDAVIRSLPQLTNLKIVACDELEGIISDAENDQQWPFLNPSSSHSPQNKSFFPNLRRLTVYKCSKLKCVLSLSTMASELPRLNVLSISECCELEQVFGCGSDEVECEGRDGEEMQIVLPILQLLILEGLPMLIDICGGFHSHLQLPALMLYRVKDCPMLSSTTIDALEHFKSIDHETEEEQEQEEEEEEEETAWFDEYCDFLEEEEADLGLQGEELMECLNRIMTSM